MTSGAAGGCPGGHRGLQRAAPGHPRLPPQQLQERLRRTDRGRGGGQRAAGSGHPTALPVWGLQLARPDPAAPPAPRRLQRLRGPPPGPPAPPLRLRSSPRHRPASSFTSPTPAGSHQQPTQRPRRRPSPGTPEVASALLSAPRGGRYQFRIRGPVRIQHEGFRRRRRSSTSRMGTPPHCHVRRRIARGARTFWPLKSRRARASESGSHSRSAEGVGEIHQSKVEGEKALLRQPMRVWERE